MTAPLFRSWVFKTKRPLASVSPAELWPGLGLVAVDFGRKATTALSYGLPSTVTMPETGTYLGPDSLQPAMVIANAAVTIHGPAEPELWKAKFSRRGAQAQRKEPV